MKRLALSLFLAVRLFAAVGIGTQWELRPTGNDANGGFFDGAGSSPGTDFSQQDAPQLSFADLASSNATTTCVVTSASHNFVAADNRNAVHIISGTNWTAGWYEVIAVSANAATLDRACGSAASVSSGTYREGGGLATIGGAVTAIQSGRAGGAGAILEGQLNIKSGTYSTAATLTITMSGEWQCFGTVHGDNAGTCLITTATNSTPLLQIQAVGNGSATIFDGINFSNTAATPALGITQISANGFYLGVRNASFTGFTVAIDGVTNQSWLWIDLLGVEIKNSTGVGVQNSGGGSITCVGCWIHGNGGTGILWNGTASNTVGVVVVNSLITNNTGRGIDSHGPALCVSSTIASNTSDGIGSGAGGGQFDTSSCILYSNGGFGVNAAVVTGSAAPFNMPRNNAFGSNTSGARQNFNAGLSDVALTANPFVGVSNFALNGNAGGGLAARANGWPGIFPGASSTGFMDIGGVQSGTAGAAGGGGGLGYGGGYTP